MLFVGDSVPLGAQGAVSAALAANFVLDFNASVSRTTADGAAVVAATPAANRRAVVVHTGHNDGADPPIFAPRLQGLMGATAGSELVVLLTIAEARPYYGGANQTIRSMALARSGVRILEWGARSMSDPSLTRPDGLHLTAAGAQALADMVNVELEGWRAGLDGC